MNLRSTLLRENQRWWVGVIRVLCMRKKTTSSPEMFPLPFSVTILSLRFVSVGWKQWNHPIHEKIVENAALNYNKLGGYRRFSKIYYQTRPITGRWENITNTGAYRHDFGRSSMARQVQGQARGGSVTANKPSLPPGAEGFQKRHAPVLFSIAQPHVNHSWVCISYCRRKRPPARRVDPSTAQHAC